MSALMTLVAVAALVGLMMGPWQTLWIDWYRQELFAARDRLFDVARSGKIGFDDPRYRALRGALEAAIRFAHRMSPFPLVAFELLRSGRKISRHASRFRWAMREINQMPNGHEILAPMLVLPRATVWMIFMRAIYLWPLLPLAFLVLVAESTLRGARVFRYPGIDRIFSAAQVAAEEHDLPRAA